MKLRYILFLLLLIFTHSEAGEKLKSFVLPGVIELQYPDTFQEELSSPIAAIRKEARDAIQRMGTRGALPIFKKMSTILILKHQNSEYAHIMIILMPPEISQEDVRMADSSAIQMINDEIAQNTKDMYSRNRMAVTSPFKSDKHVFPSGLIGIVTQHQYRNSENQIRNNRKIRIFTDDYSVIIGITTSPEVSAYTLKDIDKILNTVKTASVDQPFVFSDMPDSIPSNVRSEHFGEAKYAYRRAQNNPFLLFAFVAVSIIALIAAAIHRFLYRRANTGSPGYFYGYFIGYYLIVLPFILSLNQIATEGVSVAKALAYYAVAAIIFSVAGVFCLFRSAVAFGLGSFLTFNPLFWIISIVYSLTYGKRIWRRQAASSSLPSSTVEPQYVVHDGSNQYDPMTLDQLQAFVRQGQISAEHYYWSEVDNDWRAIKELIK